MKIDRQPNQEQALFAGEGARAIGEREAAERNINLIRERLGKFFLGEEGYNECKNNGGVPKDLAKEIEEIIKEGYGGQPEGCGEKPVELAGSFSFED